MNIHPVTIKGQIVHLEPLSAHHIPGLTKIGQDEKIWQYLPYGLLNTPEKMGTHVSEMLRKATEGTDLPFAVIHLNTQQPIGCTRYLGIDRLNRKLEIGGTWYGSDFQRTGVNTECKYLLLIHAFETLNCIRVQFKTDALNVRSQIAIERLKAVKEGVLRNHMIRPDGKPRDSVYYSILDSEWPQVRADLQKKLFRN
jgi:N-acetyltransferase